MKKDLVQSISRAEIRPDVLVAYLSSDIITNVNISVFNAQLYLCLLIIIWCLVKKSAFF